MTPTPSLPTVHFDVLAVAAHRDDVEQTCGGTLLKMSQAGRRTAILDLSRGEMGTRGTAEERRSEASDAASILQVQWRGALDIPDSRVENTYENRLKIARIIRILRPQVLILPYWQGRHPDHYTTSNLGYEAAFLAGLKKLDLSPVPDSSLEVTFAAAGSPRFDDSSIPFRPFKIVYASLYYDVRPSFVVDISAQFEARLQSLLAYKSQYAQQGEGEQLFVPEKEIRGRMETMARFYGLLAGVEYAEPFVQKEVVLEDDLISIPVQSI